MDTAEIAVIGGSGFYRFLDDASEVVMDTPYGEPSGPVTIGGLGERSVAFLARHGPSHHLPPHGINARANLWALRELGVRRVFGPCASGSLQPGIGPGDLVVLDQLVDRTWGRPDTYLDGSVDHVGFADPYCPELRAALIAAAGGEPGARPAGDQAGGSTGGSTDRSRGGGWGGGWGGGAVHPTGTVVVVQGPRFSTRAESRWYGQAGIDVINMTQYPEAYLARELGMCYAGVALVTDRDVGIEGDPGSPPVTMDAAMAVLRANVDHTRTLLGAAIPAVPVEAACGCQAGGVPTLVR
jgi:5'-methylthioadenosine phosphorylase